MNTERNPLDDYAIPGASLGAEVPQKPKDERKPSNTFAALAQRTLDSVKWTFESMTDTQKNTKYRYNSDVNYYANGSLSILARTGNLIFAKDINEANNGIFKLNQEDSHMFSSAETTTLGSSVIDTLDGLVMHPLGTVFPSTNFTPTKTWLTQFFPALGTKNLVAITVLELVQAMLFSALARENKKRTNITESNITYVDLGTTILNSEDKFY